MSNNQLTLLTPKKSGNKGLVPNEFGKYVVIPLPKGILLLFFGMMFALFCHPPAEEALETQ
eukprot:5220669-Ditylum_brightwellii.AAC.1